MIKQAIIPLSGLGTRMLPLTSVIPKELLPINGKTNLDYILEDRDTIPPEQGIFLRETRRLNKEICKYISESFYDSRLIPHQVTQSRSVKLGLNNIKDEGIFFIPTDHFGNSQRSDEEADIIHNYYSKIIGKNFEDEKGKTKWRYK